VGSDQSRPFSSGMLHEVASIRNRAASAALRPLTGAAEAGLSMERRAVDRLLESRELERLLGSGQLQAVLTQVMESEGARRLVDSFFDSGLFDRFVDRLLVSDGLWRLVDELAASPEVTAAISHQGMGFADQIGNQLRARSRKGDDRLEHTARRLDPRRSKRPVPPAGESAPAS
jgi:hypothetical protein